MGGPTRAPNRPGSQTELATTAEQVRYCLSSNIEEGKVKATHINSIRRWVIAKLHGVTRSTPDAVAVDLKRVLSEGPGPTLETLGDVANVGQGMYLPTPPLAVPLSPNVWIYVSGFPSDALPQIAPFLQHLAVGRLLVGPDRPALAHVGIGEITVERYAGLPPLDADPGRYLARLISEGADSSGRPLLPSASPYSGELGGEHGFSFGAIQRRATFSSETYELWRSGAESVFFVYQLKKIGRGGETIVDVDSRDWCRVALAIDALSGHQRSAVLQRRPEGDRLILDYQLPLAEYRLLIASGASWDGGAGGRPSLLLPSRVRPAVIDTLHRCWVDVRS